MNFIGDSCTNPLAHSVSEQCASVSDQYTGVFSRVTVNQGLGTSHPTELLQSKSLNDLEALGVYLHDAGFDGECQMIQRFADGCWHGFHA